MIGAVDHDDGLSWWERMGRIPAGSLKAQLLYISMFVAFGTAVNIVLAILMRSWIPIGAALFGWVFVGVYGLVRATTFDRGAGAVGRILVPSGDSTPSVAQHSDIETMVMRGRLREAAEAYRSRIAADPQDIVACEKLGQLALRELKEFELAVFAYREAEKRSGEPRRRLGYALLVAGIYRDNVRDNGRTMVELRKILERYPDAPNAAQLRQELDELKVRHFEGS